MDESCFEKFLPQLLGLFLYVTKEFPLLLQISEGHIYFQGPRRQLRQELSHVTVRLFPGWMIQWMKRVSKDLGNVKTRNKRACLFVTIRAWIFSFFIFVTLISK